MCLFLAGRCIIPKLDLDCPASKMANRVYFDHITGRCKQRRACNKYGNGDYFTYDWECQNVCEHIRKMDLNEFTKNDEDNLKVLIKELQNRTVDSSEN